jgi:outer membrane protein assembly factor BamB
LFVVFAIGSLSVAGEDDAALGHWPSWRGPLASGVAPQGEPPLEWSETENIRWKVELPGPGHATPIVWGDRIYVLAAVRTDREVANPGSGAESSRSKPASPAVMPAVFQPSPESPQRPEASRESPQDARPQRQPGRRGPPRAPEPTHVHQFVVLALERSTGKTIWQTVVREEVPHEAGHITASHASASPVTDGKHVWAHFGSRGLYCLDREGTVVWEKDFGDMQTRNEFGEGASPVLHGDTLVVNWDHEGDSFIVALDKRTGEQRWKVPRDEPTSWSTPLVVEDGERDLVVASGSHRVRAYDLKTGKVVWETGGLGLNCIPAPVADAERVFVMSGYREAAGLAVRYRGASGDITDTDAVAWRLDSGLSYVPSPLLYEGQLYFLERFGGMLSSYDFATGKAHYTKQRIEGLGNIYASLVGANGRVYILDRDGNAVVFRHGETFEILAENKLDDAFDASPVIVDDELILRGSKYLYSVAARDAARPIESRRVPSD